MKKQYRKALAAALAVSLAWNLIPNIPYVHASQTPHYIVDDIAVLADDVMYQQVEHGTKKTELELPDELLMLVRPDGDGDQAPDGETDVLYATASDAEDVSDTEDVSNAEDVSDTEDVSDAEGVLDAEDVSDAEASDGSWQMVSVDWSLNEGLSEGAEYDGEQPGIYVFDAEFASNRYTLGDAELPSIEVKVLEPSADGTVVDGTVADGTIIDGTAVDGTVIDGTIVDGALANGTIVNGTPSNGMAINGTAAVPGTEASAYGNILSWQWVDPEGNLTETEDGEFLLPMTASVENPAGFEDVTELLPKEITARVEYSAGETKSKTGAESIIEETISLAGWNCADYPEDGAYEGEYTFIPELPESYGLAEGTPVPEVRVQFQSAVLLTDEYGKLLDKDLQYNGVTWYLYDTNNDNKGDLVVISGNGETCTANLIWENGAKTEDHQITSMIIKEGITAISADMFYYVMDNPGYRSLKTVTIPSTVSSIGARAFYERGQLEKVEIQKKVQSIGEEAFYNCVSLTSVSIPEGVESIGANAFRLCGDLTSVSLPDTLKTIGNSAFDECQNIKKVIIPKNVSEIGPGAFYDVEKVYNLSDVELTYQAPPEAIGTVYTITLKGRGDEPDKTQKVLPSAAAADTRYENTAYDAASYFPDEKGNSWVVYDAGSGDAESGTYTVVTAETEESALSGASGTAGNPVLYPVRALSLDDINVEASHVAGDKPYTLTVTDSSTGVPVTLEEGKHYYTQKITSVNGDGTEGGEATSDGTKPGRVTVTVTGIPEGGYIGTKEVSFLVSEAASVEINGETKTYVSIIDAFKSVESGQEATITLLRDVQLEEGKNLTVSGTVTLMGDDYAISGGYQDADYGLIDVPEGAGLTIVNGTVKNAAFTQSSSEFAISVNGGALTVGENAVVIAEGDAASGVAAGISVDSGTVTIEAGTVSGTGEAGQGYQGYGVRCTGGELTITGGSISGGRYGLYIFPNLAKGHLTGGEFTGNKSAIYAQSITGETASVGEILGSGCVYYCVNEDGSREYAYGASETAVSLTAGTYAVAECKNHSFGPWSSADSKVHTHTCERCGYEETTEVHSFGEDGKCTATGCTAQAAASVATESGTEYYMDIAAAFAAAAEAGTSEAGTKAEVKLLADINYGSRDYISVLRGDIILDLNGHTLSGGNPNQVLFLEYCQMTIKDSSDGKTGVIRNMIGKGVFVRSGASLTMENGRIETNPESESWIYGTAINVALGGSLTIYDGELDGYVGVRLDEGSVTIHGGSISGSWYAVSEINKQDNVTLYGGTYTGGLNTKNMTFNQILGPGSAYYNETTGKYLTEGLNQTGELAVGETVTIKAAPVQITGEPSDLSLPYGPESFESGKAKLQVTAQKREAAVGEISYQWYEVNTEEGGTDTALTDGQSGYSGCRTDTLILPDSWVSGGSGSFYCVVSCDGYSVSSRTARAEVEVCPHSQVTDGVCQGCGRSFEASVSDGAGGEAFYYETFEEAWTAAQSRTAEITLLSNVQVEETQTVTGGSTITLTSGIGSNGEPYTISGNVFNAESGMIDVAAGGTLTLESGNVVNGEEGNNAIAVNGGTFIMNGGSAVAKQSGHSGICVYAKGNAKGSVEINGGSASGYNGLAILDGSSARISGGTFTGTFPVSENSAAILLRGMGSTTFKSILGSVQGDIQEEGKAYYEVKDGTETLITDLTGERLYGTVTVKNCTHSCEKWTDIGEKHQGTCAVCGTDIEELHEFDENGVCTVCRGYEPAEWDEAKGRYLISKPGHLFWFAKYVNGSASGDAGNEKHLDASAMLASDIDLSVISNETTGLSWGNIGTSDTNSFSGTFDGGGHTISGLYFKETVGSYRGLFGCVGKGGTVQDLNVECDLSGRGLLGGITGRNEGTITNCHVSGSLYSANEGERILADLGGIVGRNASTGIIVNCSFHGSVVSAGGWYVGGIVGANNGRVENCYNAGDVSSANMGVGGIAGANSIGATVINCYNTGAVSSSGTVESGENVGGIAGNNTGPVINCYNTGSVSGVGDTVGSIAGARDTGTTENCYFLKETASGKEGSGSVSKTETEFHSGEVTWLLNGGQVSEDGTVTEPSGTVWRQDNLGAAESMPGFTGSVVYRSERCDGEVVSYTHDSSLAGRQEHQVDENYYCAICQKYMAAKVTAGEAVGYYADIHTAWTHAKESGSAETPAVVTLLRDTKAEEVKKTLTVEDGDAIILESDPDYDGWYGISGELGWQGIITVSGGSFTMNSGRICNDFSYGDHLAYDLQVSGGTVVINDGELSGAGANVCGMSITGGDIEMNGGEINTADCGIRASQGGNIRVNKGIITSKEGSAAIWIQNSNDSSDSGAKLWIHGGTISGWDGVVLVDARVEITGGDITGENSGISVIGGTTVLTISGGRFQGKQYGLYVAVRLFPPSSITGGTFTGGTSSLYVNRSWDPAVSLYSVVRGYGGESGYYYYAVDSEGKETLIEDSVIYTEDSVYEASELSASNGYGTVTVRKQDTQTISVEVTWGAMEFTYADGKWDPDTHSYTGGGWTADIEGGDRITVTNRGSADVTVAYQYVQTNKEVSGSFMEDGDGAGNAARRPLDTSKPVTLPAGGVKTAWLALTGHPGADFSGQLGTVTVTIGSSAAGSGTAESSAVKGAVVESYAAGSGAAGSSAVESGTAGSSTAGSGAAESSMVESSAVKGAVVESYAAAGAAMGGDE